MVDIAQQQAGIGFIYNNADIPTHSNRPEVGVPGFFKLMKLHAWICRIYSQIKCCRLHRLLLMAGEFGEAVCECIGDPKMH